MSVYTVNVDRPSAGELLEHIIRADHRACHLVFNGRMVALSALYPISLLVEAELPELYQEVVDNEDHEEVS